ncbi:multidrug effflux MFS transporter [Pseudorhodobacter aquimaris]|uniref:multidrug effflux MFS transporter n=1 Tax=Pseudorhodobacter aquimaris TaxID=687412 RepID=UPI00067D384C|nr:multidrug effflux MFS transporter [Pseudorhodobacter aquimaris]
MNPSTKPIGQPEFIAMIAMLTATVAFAIDSMLPALPTIAAELSPNSPNNAQLILTSFLLGMGLGTFFVGPLSDSYGRRQIIVLGTLLYCVGAVAAYFAPTLEMMLLARVLQGLGAAGPRVVSLALVRDLYKGRQMARVVSYAMMVFSLVPAVAPLAASGIISVFGWRAIFATFILFSLASMSWLLIRQPETLPVESRRPFRVKPIMAALREVLSYRTILISIAAQALIIGALFGTLSSAQSIFETTFDRGASFPVWFALVAVCAGCASPTNAMLVERLGMRYMITRTLILQIVMSGSMLLLTIAGVLSQGLAFPAFVIWMIGVFAMAGLTLGNLNALAMESVGHIAGMAASVSGAIATIMAVILAVPVGLAFNGTYLPLVSGVGVMAVVALALMLMMPQDKS